MYGSPRILADLREDGETVSRKTVAASMRRQRLQGISPRKFTPVTTVTDPTQSPTRRTWSTGSGTPGELDRVWTSDITYLPTGQGWVYLCAVRDGCSRRVIGWAMADHLRTDLVTDALNMAVAFRGERPPQVIFHADRGTQYTSTQMAEYADAHGLACSVGRTGVCWDNAQQESFWASLKIEFYDRHSWPTRAERHDRRRRLDRTGLQPPPTPLRVEHAHPSTVRTAPPSAGRSRLTHRPPTRVKPTLQAA